MKSVFLLSLMACCALAVPLRPMSYNYSPYVSSPSYQSYPAGYWKEFGYQQQYPFGKYYQQYPVGELGQYFSTPVQALEFLGQIQQRLYHFQNQLEQYQREYPQYQWQEYVQAIYKFLNQIQQLQGYYQNYVQSSQPIPSLYQTQAIQLIQDIYYLFQQIEYVYQRQGYSGYGQGYQYSSLYPTYQWGGYGLQTSYPYSYYQSYQPYQAVQTVV